MPDVEKLFAQQGAPGQSETVVDVPFQDIATTGAEASLASATSAASGNMRHRQSSSNAFTEAGSGAVHRDMDENQIFLSRPSETGTVEAHSAPLKYRTEGNEASSSSMDEAELWHGGALAVDRRFRIDSVEGLTSVEEEAKNGHSRSVPIPNENTSNEDDDTAVPVEPLSTARFGSNVGGKHGYQTSAAAGLGGYLATVLENLPLPLDSSAQNGNEITMRPSSPCGGQQNNDSQSGCIGHSRSAQSVGTVDCVGVAHPGHHQQQTQQQQQSQNSECRRTHARHSSYEVPSSQQRRPSGVGNGCLNGIGILVPPTGAGTSGGCLVPFGRTNSLTCNGTDASSFSSSFSISSLSYSDYSASLASINDGTAGDTALHFFHKQQQQQQDENSSKRSSLDRRSLTSFCSSSSNDDANNAGGIAGFGQRSNDNAYGGVVVNVESTIGAGTHNRRLLPLTNILPRGLFSRKTLSIASNSKPSCGEDAQSGTVANEHSNNQNNSGGGTGWKLPFKPPTALASTFGSALSLSLSSQSLSLNHAKNQVHHSNKAVAAEAPSTTALILQDRPATLPPKSAEEEQRHRQLYEQMIEAAKKKEQREAKQRKKQQRIQLKQEEMLSAAVKEWTTDILPKWDEVKQTKRVRELWGHGLPPSVRGKVWKLAIGNELNVTDELFEICVNRAKERLRRFEAALQAKQSGIQSDEPIDPPSSSNLTMTQENTESVVDREGTVELIHLDVARTFPVLGIFQKGGPYYDLLLNVLGAYVCYRPDVGYMQGMSFLAAVLLLNMDTTDAFIAFANLMNQPCQLAFFRLRHTDMERYFLAYDRYFHECLPKLYAHFKSLDVRPNLYLIEWLYTLYAKSLPLEVTCRIWDIFLRDGEEFLFRTAIGILHHYEDVLLHTDFDRCVQVLTHLPENIRSSDLFRSIDEAAPASCSSSSFHLPSVRPSACGGGNSLGEKKRFMHFFNELGDSNRSSAATSASSSPSCGIGQGHNSKNGHSPSILFTYAANLLCSSNGNSVLSPVPGTPNVTSSHMENGSTEQTENTGDETGLASRSDSISSSSHTDDKERVESRQEATRQLSLEGLNEEEAIRRTSCHL